MGIDYQCITKYTVAIKCRRLAEVALSCPELPGIAGNWQGAAWELSGSCWDARRSCWGAVGKLLEAVGMLEGVAGKCLGSLFVNHLEHQPPLQVLLGDLGAPGVPIFAHLERVPLSEGL